MKFDCCVEKKRERTLIENAKNNSKQLEVTKKAIRLNELIGVGNELRSTDLHTDTE